VLPATDDQVVENPDIEEAKCLLQALGDLAVGLAGLRVPARMVVEQDDGDSVEVQGTLGDDSVVDFACVGGAAEEVLGGQDVVLGVEEDDAEDFVRQVGAAGDQVVAGLLGAVDAAQPLEALLQDGGCCEQDALLVHLELVLGRAVLGAALNRFVPTSALCASWEPAGEALGSTAPESEHRLRRAAEGRNNVEEDCPSGRDSEAKVPLRGPALVESNDVRLLCRRLKSQGGSSPACMQLLPTVLAHFAGCWLAAAAAAVSVRSLRVLMPTAFKFDSLWRASQPCIAELWDTRAIFRAAPDHANQTTKICLGLLDESGATCNADGRITCRVRGRWSSREPSY